MKRSLKERHLYKLEASLKNELLEGEQIFYSDPEIEMEWLRYMDVSDRSVGYQDISSEFMTPSSQYNPGYIVFSEVECELHIQEFFRILNKPTFEASVKKSVSFSIAPLASTWMNNL